MMEMHVPSDEGAVSEVLSDEQRDAVIDGLSDRTPADVIARSLMCELDEMAGEPPSVLDVHEAKRVLDALAAAGLRVVPIPDDNTRALATRLRKDAKDNEDVAVCMGKLAAPWLRLATDLRAAAALLDGQPEDRPDRCPTCGSPDPGFRYYECVSGYVETDPWHVGASGDTR